MTQTNIATALTWPKDTPVEIQATVSNVFDLKQGVAQNGRAWSRQDWEMQDSTGSCKGAWFNPSAQIQRGQQITVVGKVDEYQGNKKIEVKEVIFNAGAPPVAETPAAPYAPPPATPGPDAFPGLPTSPPPVALPAIAPAAPPAVAQPAPAPDLKMTVGECLEVLTHVRESMANAGFQDERAVQAFATSIVIGMQRGDIERLSLPF